MLLEHALSHVDSFHVDVLVELPTNLDSEEFTLQYKQYVLQQESCMMLEYPKPSNSTKATLFDTYFIPMLEAYGACGLSYTDEKYTDSKTNKVLDGLRFVCACCWTEGQPEYTIGTDTGSLFHNVRNHLTSGGHIKMMQKYLKTSSGDKQLLLTSLFVPINLLMRARSGLYQYSRLRRTKHLPSNATAIVLILTLKQSI